MPTQLNKINFVPEAKASFRENNLSKISFEWTIKNGRKILVLTAALVLLAFFFRIRLNHDMVTIAEHIEKNQAIIASTSNLESEHRRAQKKLSLLGTILNHQIDWSKRLNDFTQNLPQSVVLEDISYSKNDIAFNAKVKSAESFGKLIQILISNDDVKELSLVASKYDTETGNYIFSLKIILKD